MDAHRFRSLSARNRAMVAIAVLLDGHESALYLESDAVNGTGLRRAAEELASQSPELRMPFVGTMLRSALRALNRE